jgi:hypothetical protein
MSRAPPRSMRTLMLGAAALLLGARAEAALHVVILEGLPGEPAYAEQFAAQTAALRRAAANLTDAAHIHELATAHCTRAAVQSLFASLARDSSSDDRLALYLVGHGSFDGAEYKFNITGPDLTGQELARALAMLPMRDQLIVAPGSSSGALQDLLKAPTRVVITGTRGGSERNATRFGTDFAAALADAAADTDKNGAVSAQEAFDFAQRRVKDFYEREVRIASEHAVLAGGRASRFTVARLGAASASVSGAAASEPVVTADDPVRQKINDAIEALRLRKSDLAEADYNAQLEKLLLQLATLDAASAPPASGVSP